MLGTDGEAVSPWLLIFFLFLFLFTAIFVYISEDFLKLPFCQLHFVKSVAVCLGLIQS